MAKKGQGKKGDVTVKPLPHTVYPRGKQGTFVYAPDIAVYVQTDEHGVVDLSRYITNFNLQRNVNALSTFNCSFDNKFARFDRVVRRMDRIVVFMKRIQWVQVFSGYISVAPWQTIVPGDAMLQADCTLKRVAYTYWDPTDSTSHALFPSGTAVQGTSADGGSAAAMFRMLTVVAGWDPAKIQIQKIPTKWLTQTAMVINKAQDDFDADADIQQVKDSIIRLLDADGWRGVQLKGILVNSGVDISSKWTSALAGGPDGFNAVDQRWHQEVGQKGGSIKTFPPGQTTPEYVSGFVKGKLTNSHVVDSRGHTVYLRVDAAASLEALYKDPDFQKRDLKIIKSYLTYQEQKETIQLWMDANDGSSVTACSESGVKCPAGTSDHGWGTAIDFEPPSSGRWGDISSLMNQYGWIRDATGDGATNPNHWIFVGNFDQDWPAYIKASERPTTSTRASHGQGIGPGGGDTQFDWNQYNRDTGQDGGLGTGDTAFKTEFFMPQFSATNAALGKRAWINNVSLMETVANFAASSMRDMMSAPNGDFVAFFPDRLGIYGKFPAMLVRDIEIVDFKLVISDRGMVTHYASVGDFAQVQTSEGIELDVIFNSGTVSVEQPEIMALLLGLGKGEVPTGLGRAILDKFGLRPFRDDNYNLYNFGYNFMNALHRFQEAWANQWQALVTFTFMPEVFPGMRIELADKGIGVYVESVNHSGSRTGGFTSNITVSTPMRRAKSGKWVLLNMEFNIKDYVNTDRVTDDPVDAPTEAEKARRGY